jgi:hypothetical protein
MVIFVCFAKWPCLPDGANKERAQVAVWSVEKSFRAA